MDINSVFLVDFYARSFPFNTIYYGPKTKNLKYKIFDYSDCEILSYFENYPLEKHKISLE